MKSKMITIAKIMRKMIEVMTAIQRIALKKIMSKRTQI